MKLITIKMLVAGIILLVISYLALFLMVNLVPSLAEQYYDPMFSFEGSKSWLFFIHPFIISFALAWFWKRFKELFHGSRWWRGTEVGLFYGLIAVVPSMWMIYSALNISLPMVITWAIYGVLQAVIAGIISAHINP